MNTVEIYTDGSCRGNPGPGGWAALLTNDGHETILQGAEPETTNNRMELTAAIRALESLKEPCAVTLYTDSEYVMKGINEWLPAWKARGWKTAARKPVKNQDLWKALDAAVSAHRIAWRWVRGHTGNTGNERADRLANAAIDSLFKGKA
ncbi:MAG TPA: ribonuclease HI [Gammaproteobacteria bacterium]|nr:ribonuclease HI [Gammaproteobacteria bacterium]